MEYITLSDITYVAVISLILTYIYLKISKLLNIGKRPGTLNYDKNEMNRILAKCYSLFPNENLNFKGINFKRGMIVRVTTAGNKTFEGRLIGSNSQNVVCVLTKTYIAADILDNISEIIMLEDGSKQ